MKHGLLLMIVSAAFSTGAFAKTKITNINKIIPYSLNTNDAISAFSRSLIQQGRYNELKCDLNQARSIAVTADSVTVNDNSSEALLHFVDDSFKENSGDAPRKREVLIYTEDDQNTIKNIVIVEHVSVSTGGLSKAKREVKAVAISCL